jgi:Tat protein translocase TatB subunit
MLNIGPQELLLILIVALVVVGPQRLPELGRTIGKVLRELRKIQDDVKDTIKFDLNDEPKPYVRPSEVPRTARPDGNGEVTAKDTSGSVDAPEAGGPALPGSAGPALPGEAAGSPGTEATPGTEIDPEPRAVE